MTALLGNSGRRAVVAACAALALLALVLVLVGGSSRPYQVRAIFDDAANLTPGEQVKIAGVPVGSVQSVTPTPQAKAAVVMTIAAPGFEDFRTDAYCIIRPQSLLGEKYVDCRPTEAHAEGAALPPKLAVVPSGQEGAGERLLPVTNTSSPVDPDLLEDITQLPEAQRLRIILNELGVGLTGRGEDLHEVILRASPALRETNRVLAILATENHVLSRLAVDSDEALTPLAAVRRRVADFLVASNTVGTASARHEQQLAQTLADFPAFLEQVGPAMARIARFADETTPVFSDLGKAAPSIDQIFTGLPAFTHSSSTYFASLGKLGASAGGALQASEPLLERLQALGVTAKPFAGNFSELLESLRSTGGIERLMDVLFLASGATNGYDALGHFLRTDLLSADCYPTLAVARGGCEAYLRGGNSTASTSSASARAAGSASTSTSASATTATLAHTLGLIDGSKRASSSGSGASRLLLHYLLGE